MLIFEKFIIISSFIFFYHFTFVNAKKINIDVNGMVCEFCAVTIEKIFMKKKDIIEKVEIDLDLKKVFLYFKDNKNLSDEEISDIIRNNGYNVVKINRDIKLSIIENNISE